MTWRGVGVVFLGVAGAFAVSGCSKSPDWPDKPGLRVMVSFPPLYCFAANVAGEDATVQTLLDATSVHDYHPSPHDAIKLHRANLFFVNGLDLDEGFAKTLANNADNPSLKIFEIGEAKAIEDRLIKAKKDDHGHGHDHGHHHGENDPHIWLGLPEAMEMVKVIRDQLSEADPAHKEQYAKNADAYLKKLDELWKQGQKELKDKKDRKLVTFHDSLAYFARAFDLEVAGTIQPYAGEDAQARRLADLVKLCKKDKVRVIAVEPNQMTSTEADALVKELQAQGIKDADKVEIDLLESVPRSQLTPDYYEAKMKENIEQLKKALK
jgi:ABC-type Zn uptake system ZnuABC Zn-binding protein ZnuA